MKVKMTKGDITVEHFGWPESDGCNPSCDVGYLIDRGADEGGDGPEKVEFQADSWQEVVDLVEEAEVDSPKRTEITALLKRSGKLFDNAMYRQKMAAKKGKKENK